MKNPIINFDSFELPFIVESSEREDDDRSQEPYEVKEMMESALPNSVRFLGNLEAEIENWTTWNINDDYYITPITDDNFNWALFRITWDDNWGNWEWSLDARLSGFKGDYKAAAKFIIARLYENWNIDLKDKSNRPFLNFIKDI